MNKKRRRNWTAKPCRAILLIVLICVGTFHLQAASIQKSDKQRLIVTTDLGGTDPDDTQSMIHLLLCSNTIDLEGIISSQVWSDYPDRVEAIKNVVNRFCEVIPRLNKHADGFPDAAYLTSIVKNGQSKSNMDGVGEGKDSPGSELIIAAVDKRGDKRPVWIAAWGGMNNVAQALWKVAHTRSQEELKRFTEKIRIYDVLGQDDAGAWIAKNYPDIPYIRNKAVYGWSPSDKWIKENIQSQLPFGACYPDRKWATEGDSPSFLYLLANGLNMPEHVDYGGWGGRFDTQKAANIQGMDFIRRSGKDETQYDPYYMYGTAPEGGDAIRKWQAHIWNDFAARMAWTTTDDYSAVNHHPTAAVGKDRSLKCRHEKARPGDVLQFDASRSSDPDGDSLNFRWTVYAEPSTYKGTVDIEGGDTPRCRVAVPANASGKTIHLILTVTDDGTPALTAYRRIVIEVR